MSSEEDRLLRLLQGIHHKTSRGEIPWARTGSEDTFVASFPNFSLTSTTELASSEDENYDEYHLLLINDKDRLVEDITEFSFDRIYRKKYHPSRLLREIFYTARRQALALDPLIDEVFRTFNIPDSDGPLPGYESSSEGDEEETKVSEEDPF